MKSVTKSEMEFTIREVSAGLLALDKKEEVKNFLLTHGYKQEDFDHLDGLCKRAEELYGGKESKTRFKLKQSRESDRLIRTVRRAVYHIVRMLRKKFKKNPEVMALLGLSSGIPRRKSAYLEWAKDFLVKVNADEYIGSMKGVGVNNESLTGILQMIADLEALDADRQFHKGEKEETTAERNKTIDELSLLWDIFKKKLLAWYADSLEKLEGIFYNVPVPKPRSAAKDEEDPDAEPGDTVDDATDEPVNDTSDDSVEDVREAAPEYAAMDAPRAGAGETADEPETVTPV